MTTCHFYEVKNVINSMTWHYREGARHNFNSKKLTNLIEGARSYTCYISGGILSSPITKGATFGRGISSGSKIANYILIKN